MTLPDRLIITKTLCSLIANFRHTTPALSLRCVTLATSPCATNSFIALVLWSSPAMPTMVTLPSYCFASSDTAAAWPRQVLHQGAQNHRTTGRPASFVASNGLPSSVVPVNFRDSGITAGGAGAAGEEDAADLTAIVR